MTQELKDQIEAAYAAERFTMTVTDIETRAGLRRRRNTWRLVAAGFASATLVAAGFLLAPKTSPDPQQPAAVDELAGLERSCAANWKQNGTGPMPPRLTQRQSGGISLLFFGDETTAVACLSNGAGLVLNQERKPIAHGAPDLTFVTQFSEVTVIFGWAPRGSKGIAATDRSGNSQSAEVFGSLFFMWDPLGKLGTSRDGSERKEFLLLASSGNYSIFQHYAQQVVLDPAKSAPACQESLSRLPRTAVQSNSPSAPLRFTHVISENQTIWLFGDDNALYKCRVGPRVEALSFSPDKRGIEPFDQVFNVSRGGGYIFGKAPAGAQSGEVTLGGGRSIALSVKDGFYSAYWVTEDLREVPVQVRIDTATERLVHGNGQTARGPK